MQLTPWTETTSMANTPLWYRQKHDQHSDQESKGEVVLYHSQWLEFNTYDVSTIGIVFRGSLSFCMQHFQNSPYYQTKYQSFEQAQQAFDQFWERFQKLIAFI